MTSFVESPLRFLALGDSYSIGEGVPAHERWPDLLAAVLRAHSVLVAEPEVLARTGWTTGDLLEGIAHRDPLPVFDLVSLQIGVNNQYQGVPVDTFERELARLLDVAAGLAVDGVRRLFVLSIPDWGRTPFASGRNRDRIRQEIDVFNAVVRTSAIRRGARFFDITDVSDEWAGRNGGLAADGLHPSGRQYAAWVSSFAEDVATMCQASK